MSNLTRFKHVLSLPRVPDAIDQIQAALSNAKLNIQDAVTVLDLTKASLARVPVCSLTVPAWSDIADEGLSHRVSSGPLIEGNPFLAGPGAP